MSGPPKDFDPESPEKREVAGEAARDRSDFLSLMGHTYRGELGRTTSWRTRIDRTTNWAVVLTASLLTWAFSAETRPHYILLVGMGMLVVFLGIEARRYRIYDVWRSRVRLLEENVFANALDPEGTEQPNWRELLSDDLREPTIKTPPIEAVSRRLARVYTPLLSVLLAAWLIRLTVFGDPTSGPIGAASIGRIPGEVVLGLVGVCYALVIVVTFWPGSRQAKGELQEEDNTEAWR
ncbi:conserved hypothetical protein [Halorhabdus utahensis DSM 12940]|uniref:DUF2270 domain-containing protein n=1 Tax=Halorhabdus utahensis (strain DSM 12940 / JCM 11049 / AX-2) TaxID=519442 RepID=C7NV09_HALUD|nr:DUF2270 domain-containing protein [Halorhabdus utahensis]ACV12421.1 conserved hypothetical protein [Halorhabdus utahensis DSM 12940]